MTKFFLPLFLVFMALHSTAQNKPFHFYTEEEQLKKDNDNIIAEIEKTIKDKDPSFSFNGTTTIVENNSPYGYYLPSTNNIYLPMWSTMAQEFKDLGTNTIGSKEDGEEMSRHLYYGFFLPHEIAHSFQFNAKVRYDNEYDNEQDASNFALLYWRKKGMHKELQQCYILAKKIIANLKNPIPPGEDVKQYFTTHYYDFQKDPTKYPYIIGYQIVQAFEDESLPDFDTYIQQRLADKKVNSN